MKLLPVTGTAALLETISPHIPDDLIDSLWIHRTGRGRPRSFWPSQLFRVSLLPLLTPARSFNLIVQLLGEQRALRSFARLPNRLAVPDVRMLHEFRDTLDLSKLRRVNEFLLEPLIEGTGALGKTVALIDSTDLPAATNTYKKNLRANTPRTGPKPVRAAAKMGKAAISSGTKNTPFGYGSANTLLRSCWCLWSHGRHRPIATIRCFWSRALTIAEATWVGLLTSWLVIWVTSA
jgi:hypothetical protein